MHLVVDLLFLVPGQTGGRETYARELLPRLRAVRPDWRMTAVVARESGRAGWWADAVDDVAFLGAASGRARARWALGELVLLPRVARGADLVWGVANFAPVAGGPPRVLTVHDAIWLRHPATVPAPARALTTAMVRPAARRARAVIAVSASGRDDVVELLGVPASRVHIVPNGIAPPAPAGGDAARGRALAGAPANRPIVLSVATNIPHKNLGALAAAVSAIDVARRPVAVLAGHGTEVLDAPPDVRGLGRVSDQQLEDLYAAADAVVLPTLHEGFGLPVLEALARDVPVVCSAVPALQEIAGDAAAFFDPRDPRAISARIEEALAGGADVERRRVAGRARAAMFTWEAAADATARVHETAVPAR